MNLYTFIMDYLGGTYISQVKANNERAAMRKWLYNLDVSGIKGFGEKNKERLINEDFYDENPVLILGCVNTWCFNLRTTKGFAFINFIKTERQ
jgi:hypothetical protein